MPDTLKDSHLAEYRGRPESEKIVCWSSDELSSDVLVGGGPNPRLQTRARLGYQRRPLHDLSEQQLHRLLRAHRLSPSEYASAYHRKRHHKVPTTEPRPGTAAAAIPRADLRDAFPAPKPAPAKRLSDEPYLTADARREDRMYLIVGSILVAIGVGCITTGLIIGIGPAATFLIFVAGLLGASWLWGLRDA